MLDPDPWVFGSALKPMRIRNTAYKSWALFQLVAKDVQCTLWAATHDDLFVSVRRLLFCIEICKYPCTMVGRAGGVWVRNA
jgi:hypothetical protein